MSEARAITNMIGNGVGTIVIAKWDGSLDQKRMRQVLDGRSRRRPARRWWKPPRELAGALVD
jgi:Na+/H+-dicarboxylate symporter